MHIRTRLAASVAFVLALTGLLVPPAAADDGTIWDRRGDGSDGAGGGARKWGDLRQVRIDHTGSHVAVNALPPAGGMAADEYFFWIDVDGTDPEPDFVAWLTFVTGPDVSLHRASGFDDLGRRRCALSRPRLDVNRQSVQFRIPRRCLRLEGATEPPGRIRFSVETWMEYEPADWAPRRLAFGPWVAAG